MRPSGAGLHRRAINMDSAEDVHFEDCIDMDYDFAECLEECGPPEEDVERVAMLAALGDTPSRFGPSSSGASSSTDIVASPARMSLSPPAGGQDEPVASSRCWQTPPPAKRPLPERTPEEAARLPEISEEPVRRRILHKQPRHVGPYQPPAPDCQAAAEVGTGIWTGFEKMKFPRHREQYLFVWYKLRRWLKQIVEQMSDEEKKEARGKVFVEAFRSWREVRNDGKQQVVLHFLQATSAPQALRVWAQACWPDTVTAVEKKERYYIYARGILLTWNGPWGVIPADSVPLSSEWRVVVAALREHAAVCKLWDAFSNHVDGLVEVTRANEWASSLEMCMDSWQETGQVRVHCHLYLKSQPAKMYAASSEPFVLLGSLPHRAHMIQGMQHRASGSYCGLYYLSCPKIGQVLERASVRAYKQYPVCSSWIFSMLQSDKMEVECARKELIKTGKGLQRAMGDLDKLTQLRRELAIEARIAHVRSQIQLTDKAYKAIPDIEDWREAAQRPYQRRKRFLVLDGPSGLGKTEYVKGLFSAAHVLELNCANCGSAPDLRPFQTDRHKCVLFDEGSVKMVLNNRKLFQAPPCLVDLGHSPTGRDVYRVFLNDAVLVISSNRWAEDCSRLESKSDLQWIQANQVLVVVSEPMYVL